jgi:hypothetical protein
MQTVTTAGVSRATVKIDERALTAVITAATTLAAGYFGVAAPAQKQSELNRDGNFSCRDQLVEVKAERDDWIERYLMEHP